MADDALYLGKKTFKDYVHPQTGRVLIPAGATVSATHIKNLKEGNLLDGLSQCIDMRTRFKDLDGFEIEIPELPDIMAMFNVQPPPAASTQRKVLVVDDAPFMRNLLIRLLEGGGFSCFEAGTGREAIGKYAQIKPDVVTLDINMPDIDGFATLQALRQLDPKACVIMCTSSGHIETVQRAITHGAAGYLRKPVTPEALNNALREIGLPFAAPAS